MRTEKIVMTVYLYNSLEKMEKGDEFNCNKVFIDTNNIPRIGDKMYFPHHGTYMVTNVIYHCSDDIPLKNGYNEIMFVCVDAVKIK